MHDTVYRPPGSTGLTGGLGLRVHIKKIASLNIPLCVTRVSFVRKRVGIRTHCDVQTRLCFGD